MGLFKRFDATVARTPEENRAENLRHWRETQEGTTPISEVVARSRVRVAGVIQNIRVDPTTGSGTIDATFTDGTGQLIARWLGRQSLTGIRLGAGLLVEGTVGVGDGGRLHILNPEYRLVPGPEHH